MNRNEIIGLCNSIIMIADKFIVKVETGKARSKETLNDLTKLRAEAKAIKVKLTVNE